MSIKIAVVGATGSVGREILNILDERMSVSYTHLTLPTKRIV